MEDGVPRGGETGIESATATNIGMMSFTMLFFVFNSLVSSFKYREMLLVHLNVGHKSNTHLSKDLDTPFGVFDIKKGGL